MRPRLECTGLPFAAAVVCLLVQLAVAVAADPWRDTGPGKVVKVVTTVTFADGRRVVVEESPAAYAAARDSASPAKSPAAGGCPVCGKGCSCGPACDCNAETWRADCAAHPANQRRTVPCEVQAAPPPVAAAPPVYVSPPVPVYYGPPAGAYYGGVRYEPMPASRGAAAGFQFQGPFGGGFGAQACVGGT